MSLYEPRIIGGQDDITLDVLTQNPRINQLYTQLTFCFPLNENSSNSRSEITNVLTKGLERLTTSFPWVSGKVVDDNGSFKISHLQAGHTSQLSIKDFTHD